MFNIYIKILFSFGKTKWQKYHNQKNIMLFKKDKIILFY